jgi:hypothetical protein
MNRYKVVVKTHKHIFTLVVDSRITCLSSKHCDMRSIVNLHGSQYEMHHTSVTMT